MRRFFRRQRGQSLPAWKLLESEAGVLASLSTSSEGRALHSETLGGWFDQLLDEGYAREDEQGIHIAWESLYLLKANPEHADVVAMLDLPNVQPITCSLVSRGSLGDADFSISIDQWYLDGRPESNLAVRGAIATHSGGAALLPAPTWNLVSEIRAFSRRPADSRNGANHRLEWGKIRQLAIAASANLDSFLQSTIVLSPEKLAIGIRKQNVAGDTIIEVQPTFDGAPLSWIDRFDQHSTVQSRYDIPTEAGIVQVVVTPKVRTVLEEIKRLDHRRVAGARAQAFILNPFAALGADATSVIDEQQFEKARAEAGLRYERFLPQFERDARDYPVKVGLLIESASSDGPTFSEIEWLDDAALGEFIDKLRNALSRNHQLLGWNGYDLALPGDASEHLQALEKAKKERETPQLQITYADVYDLSNYMERVEGIGFEKPYYSPFILKRKDDEGWFPENIIPAIAFTPEGETEAVVLPISQKTVVGLEDEIAAATDSAATAVSVAGLPTQMPIDEARNITRTFKEVNVEASAGTFNPEKLKASEGHQPVKRKSPVILANIIAIDYQEIRRAALDSSSRNLVLPSSLRSDCNLLEHQKDGVAWLQTLYSARKSLNCRGAVLADDMGLGKTLQLLTLMAWAIENDSNPLPMLVVAPVSLLENWREEVQRFFKPDALSILTAYGDDLATLRVPRELIDERLRTEDGLTRFLKPGWVNGAHIVLTTYETLRDLEFSFATERWSIMVCDEAQRIKNPAAMVTRAAKKQNVGFKIACTGTPVENTLADLWCLFDYVQPGLLGALNDFSRRYRKPIEARTDDEKARVDELRRLIAPQILRRTKIEVAKNLPQKIIVSNCRDLPLSKRQRELYAHAIDSFKQRNDPGAIVPFKNHLGLLHYLRLICTDPRRFGLDVFTPEPILEYRTRAPKMEWLLTQLELIRQRDEKVIVFCEFRNIQRLLQHYIAQTFTIRPDIINGDTPASVANANSRQKRIRAFQEMSGFAIIILSPVAVGFGVNIQAANHVIHYTRTWNPAKEDQATDRAYRIGQTRDVFVYYPVVTAPDFATFDVKLDQLLEIKRSLAGDMLNGSGDLQPRDFKLEDVAPPESRFQEELVNLHTTFAMSPDYFEALVAVLYRKRGYDSIKTPQSGDRGVDVIALHNGSASSKLIQTKKSSIDDRALGWDAVKDVVAGKGYYSLQFPGVEFELICLTNNRFQPQAHEQAAINSVHLIEQAELESMLKETPITLMEVESVIYTTW